MTQEVLCECVFAVQTPERDTVLLPLNPWQPSCPLSITKANNTHTHSSTLLPDTPHTHTHAAGNCSCCTFEIYCYTHSERWEKEAWNEKRWLNDRFPLPSFHKWQTDISVRPNNCPIFDHIEMMVSPDNCACLAIDNAHGLPTKMNKYSLHIWMSQYRRKTTEKATQSYI